MGMLSKLFRNKKKNSAAIARERLHIIVAHQRADMDSNNENVPAYLPKLQQEIMDVISKYVEIDEDQLKVELSQNDHSSVLELNVTLPEEQR